MQELTITVFKDEAEKDYQTVMRDFKKHVVVPGYRKGKAPASMLINMFGDNIKQEYIRKKVEEYFKKAIDEKQLEPLNRPELVDVKWDPGQDFIAVFNYEIQPVIEINNYTGLEIPYTPNVFNEQAVSSAIDDFKKQRTKVNTADSVGKDCMISLSGEVVNDKLDDKKLPQQLNFIDMNKHEFGDQFEKDILGAKKNDVVETTAVIDGEQGLKIRVKVESIAKPDMPELTDEFLKKEGFESLEHFRQSISEDVEKRIIESNKDNKIMAVNLALIEKNPFDIPPSSVIEYSRKIVEPYSQYTNASVDELSKQFMPQAIYRLKSYYLEEKLLEMLSFEVSEQDEQQMIDIFAKELNLTSEEYLKRNPDVTKQPEFVDKVKKDKLYDYLFEQNTFVEENKEKGNSEEK